MSVEHRHSMPDDIPEGILSEVLPGALESIPRSDQRRRGELYVRGLLTVAGKKTMRALANGAGNSVEQSLYQFITKSTWRNGPVRRAMARLVTQRLSPRAWVVHPLVITKVGDTDQQRVCLYTQSATHLIVDLVAEVVPTPPA